MSARSAAAQQKKLKQKLVARKAEQEKERVEGLSVEQKEEEQEDVRKTEQEKEDEMMEKLKAHIAKLEESEKNNPNIENPHTREVLDRLRVLEQSSQAPDALKQPEMKGVETSDKWTGSMVGVGGAKVVSEGDISPEEQVKLQALLGNAKATNMKTYAHQTGVKKVLTKSDYDRKATLVFQGCNDCEYTLDYLCTKVFVQVCNNFKLIIDKKVVTQTVEFYKCNNVTMQANKKIRTCQVDMSNNVKLVYKTRDNIDGVIWAGCEDLMVRVEDADKVLKTGFKEVSEEFADLNIERSQFKIEWLNGKLQQDKLVRLDNGFPTTVREANEYERKQEAAIQDIAKRMGITINRKKEDIEGKKPKRNDPCICGSKRKYKKCCGK